MVIIPDKKSLAVSEKIITAAESLQRTPRYLYVILATVVVLMVPLTAVLRVVFYNLIISGYAPPKLVYSEPQPQALGVVDKRIFPAGGTLYHAYARIANPNADLGVRVLRYRFKITGAGGEVLANHDATSYVLPGQERLLFMPALKLASAPETVEIELMPERWSRIGNIRTLNFSFQQAQTGKDLSGHFFASGVFNNENPYIIPKVELGVLLYNIKHEVVGVNFTVLSDIQLNENRFFRVIWPLGITYNNVTNVEFRASVNLLEKNSVLTEKLGPGADDVYPR